MVASEPRVENFQLFDEKISIYNSSSYAEASICALVLYVMLIFLSKELNASFNTHGISNKKLLLFTLALPSLLPFAWAGRVIHPGGSGNMLVPHRSLVHSNTTERHGYDDATYTTTFQIHESKQCLVPNGSDTPCPICDNHGLTIGVLFYNEVEYLEEILMDWSRWSESSTQATEFLIVDDGSDHAKAASLVLRRVSAHTIVPDVRVVTVTDRLEWNIGGSRNLLMHVAQRCRVVMLDNDYILPETLASELRAVDPNGHIYRLKRNHPGKSGQHPGIMFTTPSTYWSIGGADEDFVGHYGWTDPHIVHRAARAGVPVSILESKAHLQPQAAHLNRPVVERDPSYNARLFQSKMHGEVPWSTTFLRFRWSQFTNIVAHMTAHPQRAHFADLFRLGGFRSGAEVGVASGRFSEHLLIHGNPNKWVVVEPFPNQNLASRLPIVRSAAKYDENSGLHELARDTWAKRGIDTNITFFPYMSLDDHVMNAVPSNSLDFVYLDGAHDYENVKAELDPWFERVSPGGILAGHDYQHHGEFKSLACRNCQTVPMAQPYTPYGIEHGKSRDDLALSQAGVVRAVQEWLVETHPELEIHFTKEDFTRESLLNDGFDYDLVVTNTRNPSWYVVKPITPI